MSPLRFPGPRVAGFQLLVIAVVTARLTAQPPRVAFDYRSELIPGRGATVQVRGDFNGDAVPDLLLAGPGGLTRFEQGSTSFEWSMTVVGGTNRTPLAAANGRFNGDARDDVVILCGSKPPVAEIWLTDPAGIQSLSAVIDLPGEFRHVLAADADGDRDLDLLFYGKKTLGIALYTGNGKGAFTEGPTLLSEIPVSLAAVAPMDADDIPDLVIADWIDNTIEVHPGFGSLNFGDPAVIRFDEEAAAIAVGDINGDRNRDIVTGFGEHPAFRIHSGDGAGGFGELERGELPSPPEKIRIGDLDGDGRNDLLMFMPSQRSLMVRFQDAAGRYGSGQSFSTGSSPSDVVFFQDSRRRGLNAAVLSAEENIVRLLHTRTTEPPDPSARILATGVDPAGVEVADLNGDGWDDVALSLAAEPALNLFINDGRGSLRGQLSLPLPSPASGLLALAGHRGERDLLSPAADGRSISWVTIDAATLASSARVTVRTAGALDPVDGRRLPDGTGLRFYGLRGGAGSTGTTVYAYEAADRTRYGEEELQLEVTGTVVGTAVVDLDGDGRRDVAVLTASGGGGICVLSRFRQTDDTFVAIGTIPFRYPSDDAPAASLIWFADLDADGSADMILNPPKSPGTLLVALGRGDTAFGPASVVQTDVRIPDRRALSVSDFDSDGRADLVFLNDRTKTVQFLPGNGMGEFDGPVNLTSARGVGGFAVADIDRDNEKELLLTIADAGVLTITSFHHPLFVRKKVRGRE